MYSSTYDVKELCYIAPVIKKEIDKINVIFEDLVILETYDNYKFIPRSWLKMCPSRKNNEVYALFAEKFLSRSTLNNLRMNNNKL